MAEMRIRKVDDAIKAVLKSEAAKRSIFYEDYIKEILAKQAAKLATAK